MSKENKPEVVHVENGVYSLETWGLRGSCSPIFKFYSFSSYSVRVGKAIQGGMGVFHAYSGLLTYACMAGIHAQAHV